MKRTGTYLLLALSGPLVGAGIAGCASRSHETATVEASAAEHDPMAPEDGYGEDGYGEAAAAPSPPPAPLPPPPFTVGPPPPPPPLPLPGVAPTSPLRQPADDAFSAPEQPSDGAAPPPLVSKELRWVRVFFGTNRARTPGCAGAVESAPDHRGCRPDRFYAGLPAAAPAEGAAELGSDLEVGVLRVTFPLGHEPGRIERPMTVLTIALRDEDPDLDVVISELRTFPGDYDGWADEVRATGREQAFVYVHGYATHFDDAARRAAQIAYDLDFDLDEDFRGIPMLYSWPSRGETGAYLADADAALEAVDAFNRFLDLIRQQGGIRRVHVIAHSMGNQLVANALRERSESSERVVDELVLAAPDIWASRFKQRFLRTLPRHANRVTLYVSDRDRALIASSRIREDEPRAGQVAGGLLRAAIGVERFDAIDASSLETDFLGHSYYANNDSMLSDIYCLLKGMPAEGRPLLMLVETAWRFRPPTERPGLEAALCVAPLRPPEPSTGGWIRPAAGAGLLLVGLGLALALVARRQRRSRA